MNDGSGGRARAVVIILAATGAFLIGCGTGNPYAPGTFERAVHYAEHEDYQFAADAFGVFVRQNPADSLAAEAQFRKAMAYVALREFPLAAVELQILQKDYPTSPLVEEAMFREGEAYLAEVGRLERDVSGADSARDHFQRFIRTYPQSTFLPQVHARLAEIADLLVRKRLQAVDVYEKLGRWQAAGLTLEHILADEPASSLRDQVLMRRAAAARKTHDDATARAMYEQLLAEYPASPLAKRARAELDSLGPADVGEAP